MAHWTANGLTAYDAAYVAVAEQTGLVLITDDRDIPKHAPEIALALGPESSAWLADLPSAAAGAWQRTAVRCPSPAAERRAVMIEASDPARDSLSPSASDVVGALAD